MIITPVRTAKLTTKDVDLIQFLDTYITQPKERTILVFTSKIISILEKNYIPVGAVEKIDLIQQEAEWYLPPNKYNMSLTIKNNLIIPSAGIDESNAFNHYILWPTNPFKTAKTIWKYLKKKYHLNKLGIIITDSRTTPLRWGTTGISIGYCGFSGIKNYIGKKDIFGRTLHFTKANIADGIASGAVAIMGEGEEQTPIVIIEDVPQTIMFYQTPPTKKEIVNFSIPFKDDLYYPILSRVKWKKGGEGRKK